MANGSLREQFYNVYLAPILEPIYNVFSSLGVAPTTVIGLPVLALLWFSIRHWKRDPVNRVLVTGATFCFWAMALVLVLQQVGVAGFYFGS